ncbi:MAG: hypothetical protein K1X28_04955 [Parachlamydiales bacterium]|nr:hypothetical protein [Parachlamydiales bacterium]
MKLSQNKKFSFKDFAESFVRSVLIALAIAAVWRFAAYFLDFSIQNYSVWMGVTIGGVIGAFNLWFEKKKEVRNEQ